MISFLMKDCPLKNTISSLFLLYEHVCVLRICSNEFAMKASPVGAFDSAPPIVALDDDRLSPLEVEVGEAGAGLVEPLVVSQASVAQHLAFLENAPPNLTTNKKEVHINTTSDNMAHSEHIVYLNNSG
jgi:hypothetical protein